MGTIYFRITGEQVAPWKSHFQGKMKGSKLL